MCPERYIKGSGNLFSHKMNVLESWALNTFKAGSWARPIIVFCCTVWLHL